MYTLFHYEHCPFCVRVRFALGLLGVPYESVVLDYDDKETPEKMTGKKMLPIMKTQNSFMNESLDIIKLVDTTNRLKVDEVIAAPEFKELESYISYLSNLVHSLAMPYWIWTPEFNESSRKYFQDQKEKKRGPFKDLVKNRDEFISKLNAEWIKLGLELKPFYKSEKLTLNDILIASHLWGLYVVPEFQFPEKIHQYLQNIKNECHFDYHQDFWR